MGVQFPEQALYDRQMAKARTLLSENAFAVAWEEPGDEYNWQADADAGWESYVGVSRDDPDWDMMEESAADAMFERSERD